VILQALYDLAQREGLMEDPDYEPKPVAWLIRVGPGGKFLGITGTHYTLPAEGKRKPRTVAKTFSVPRERARTSGARAFLLFDKAEYVLGRDPAGKRAEKQLKERSQLFRDRVTACANTTKDEAAKAVSDFLETVAGGQAVVELPDECSTNDLFTFAYAPDDDALVLDRQAVRTYWKDLRSEDVGTADETTLCLVSGKESAASELFPLIKKVPGGSTSGVALVSFNSNAFESYGWSGNRNAGISREASEACSTALNRLVHPAFPKPGADAQTLPRRNIKLSADTVVCYWSAAHGEDDFASYFAGLVEGNPDEVKEAYHSVWRGRPPRIDDPSAFYALTLTGTQGRAIVRDWFESTVAEVVENLAQHFADLDLERLTRPAKGKEHLPSFPLPQLLEALADPTTTRSEGVPAPLLRDLVRSALSGTPYPFAALQRAVLRYRAEIGRVDDDRDGWKTRNWNDARAAIIKAVLNRRRRQLAQTAPYEEVKRDMDPTNASPGYALGRLMAVLERIQQEAIGDVNASVVDRYFSGASASPKSVFVRLLKNARHHVRKAAENDQKGGFVVLLDRLVDELAGRFDPEDNGFPAFLDLEQQGLFVLGYHQMRRWLWMNRDERTQWEAGHPEAPRAYLWGTGK